MSEKKGLVGESLAGLFVVTFLVKPDLFDFYIAMDPSLWWNDAALVKASKEHLNNFSGKEIAFWFAGSSAEDISTHAHRLNEY